MIKKWVIPDIHGCVLTLKTLIETQIKPNKNDHLIFLGDYIDRGPDSQGVIDYIMDMQKNDFNITALMGNHEDYCVRAYDEDVKTKDFWDLEGKPGFSKNGNYMVEYKLWIVLILNGPKKFLRNISNG